MRRILKNLGNLVRSSVLATGMTLPVIFGGCCEENYPPVAKLDVSPLTGEVPLNVRTKVTGFDENGPQDIVKYNLGVNNKEISRSSPIDTIYTFTESGIYKMYGKVVDSKGESDRTEEVSVEVYGKPFIEQSASLSNEVNIKYEAILYRVPQAELRIIKNGEQFATQNITDVNQTGKDFEKIFSYTSDGITKGNYEYTLKAGELEKKTSVEVPNYKPSVSSIAPVNFLEETDTTITLPKPSDKNPEDIPNISYIGAVSLDGKTTPTLIYELGATKLKIKGNKSSTGEYSIELEFGSQAGGLEKKILTGNIAKDTRIKVDPFSSTNSNGAAYDLLKTKAQRDSLIQVKLNEDWVSKILPSINPLWDCTEYSNQLCINLHGFPDLTGYSGFNLDSIYYYHKTLKDNGKYGLPVYNVVIPTGLGHEMNVSVTGNSLTTWNDLNFIEPQFDQINVQPGQAYMPMNCEIEIRAPPKDSQGNYRIPVPIIRFKVENGIPSLIWENDDPNVKIIKQR